MRVNAFRLAAAVLTMGAAAIYVASASAARATPVKLGGHWQMCQIVPAGPCTEVTFRPNKGLFELATESGTPSRPFTDNRRCVGGEEEGAGGRKCWQNLILYNGMSAPVLGEEILFFHTHEIRGGMIFYGCTVTYTGEERTEEWNYDCISPAEGYELTKISKL